MKLFSRWLDKKENLKKRAEQRQAAKEKVEAAKKEAGIKVVPEEKKVEAAPAKIEKDFKKGKWAYHLLLKPQVTEKSTYLQSGGQYCFVVHPSANKIEIKKAVEGVYGVKVLKVRIMNYQGKKVSYGRVRGVRKNWKKAIVTLAQGQKIEIHKNV